MADLDVTDILSDPDFMTSFAVIRRAEATTDKGRVQITPTEYPGIVGVITRTNPNEVKRDDDGARMGRSITIVTQFRLYGEEGSYQDGTTFQPDQICWGGDLYTVQSVDPYTHFGQGFVQATAMVQRARVAPVR